MQDLISYADFSSGDNLHEMSNLDLWENKKISICRLLNKFSESGKG